MEILDVVFLVVTALIVVPGAVWIGRKIRHDDYLEARPDVEGARARAHLDGDRYNDPGGW